MLLARVICDMGLGRDEQGVGFNQSELEKEAIDQSQAMKLNFCSPLVLGVVVGVTTINTGKLRRSKYEDKIPHQNMEKRKLTLNRGYEQGFVACFWF